MNPLNINHIKEEKANAIKLRYQKFRKMTNFFRVFEIFLIFAVISRLSFQVPLALFKLSNEYIHKLSIFLGSPQFVFIVGNAIVITLFVNSGKFHNNNNNKSNIKAQKNSNNNNNNDASSYVRKNNARGVEQKNVKNKQERTDENTMMAMIFSTPEHQVIKIYQRSKSEKMMKREKVEKKCCGLRRSNTEIKSLRGCGCSKEGHYPEDHMSNEEFQKTIENFIARQQRFIKREEEFCLN